MSEKKVSTRTNVQDLYPGLELARPVTVQGSGGKTLLEVGLVLQQSHINKLHDWGIDQVFVFTDPSQEIKFQKAVDDTLKLLSDQAKEDAIHGLSSTMDLLNTGQDIHLNDLQEISQQLLEVLSLDKSELVRATHTMKDQHFLVRHGLSVAIFSLVLANSLGLSQKEIHTLGHAALMHDLGCLKGGEATFDHVHLEEGVLKVSDLTHVQESVSYCQKVQGLEPEAIKAIEQHHTYCDGPKVAELTQVSRILAVADVFIHLTQPFDRSKRIRENDAVKAIMANKKMFHEDILRKFMSDFAIYPVGSMVLLSSGAKAVVVGTNKDKPFRPVVKLTHTKEGHTFDHQVIQDLNAKEHHLVFIQKSLEGEFDFASLL